MNDFETRVLPVITKLANRCFKDEQKRQDAIGLCWYRYQQAEKRLEVTATSFAQFAVKQTWSGRGLPGTGLKERDALDRAWQGAGMGLVQDKSPGPDKIAQDKDEWEAMVKRLNHKQRILLDRCHLDMSNLEMARLMGVSPARVSQVRREIERMTRE